MAPSSPHRTALHSPVPNSMSTKSSKTMGRLRDTNGWITLFPFRCWGQRKMPKTHKGLGLTPSYAGSWLPNTQIPSTWPENSQRMSF